MSNDGMGIFDGNPKLDFQRFLRAWLKERDGIDGLLLRLIYFEGLPPEEAYRRAAAELMSIVPGRQEIHVVADLKVRHTRASVALRRAADAWLRARGLDPSDVGM